MEPNEGHFQVVRDWYSVGYDKTYHTGFIGWVYRLVYKFMEQPHRNRPACSILEVGAGQGDYRKLAAPHFTRYVELDLRPGVEPTSCIEKIVGDAQSLDQFKDGEFDRLIATCVLAHLVQPFQALQEWRRVIRPGGSLTIYVPPEAGLFVRTIRRAVTWRGPRSMGLDARRIASLQHRYSYFFMEALIQEVFADDNVVRRTIPFRFFEFDLALFHVFEITRAPE